MAIARLNRQIFNSCESTVLERKGFTSSWDGGLTNRSVKCKSENGVFKIFMNGYWWNADKIDWETSMDYKVSIYREKERYKRVIR